MIKSSKKTLSLNLLITCVGGDYGPEVISRFKKNTITKKIKIFGTDIKKEGDIAAKKFLDKFYQVPKGYKSPYLKKIDQIVKKNKIDLILVTSDEESLVLSKKYQFSNTKVACSDYKNLIKISNKIETYKLLEKNKIELPYWCEIKKENQVIKAINNFKKKRLDFCIKPAISRGGRDVYVINNKLKKIVSFQDSREKHLSLKNFKKNYKNLLNKKYPLLMMEKLKTPVYDLDILSKNGFLINSVCRRRIHSALPNSGHIIVNNKKLDLLAKKLSKIFNLNFLHDCDLMIDNKNNFKILEINPRPSGSFIVAEAAGFPVIDNILKIYFNDKKFLKPSKIYKKIIPFKSLSTFGKIKTNT